MRISTLILLLLAAGGAAAQRDPAREQRITALLSKMTLEEKIGQMTQVTIDVVLKKGAAIDASDPIQLDSAKLKEAVETYHVGSILNTSGHALSRDKWKEIITGIEAEATQHTRLKIPVIYGIDAIARCQLCTGRLPCSPRRSARPLPLTRTWCARPQRSLPTKQGRRISPGTFPPFLTWGKSPSGPVMYETYAWRRPLPLQNDGGRHRQGLPGRSSI